MFLEQRVRGDSPSDVMVNPVFVVPIASPEGTSRGIRGKLLVSSIGIVELFRGVVIITNGVVNSEISSFDITTSFRSNAVIASSFESFGILSSGSVEIACDFRSDFMITTGSFEMWSSCSRVTRSFQLRKN